MTEVPLAGGDVNIGENVVVRVDDTVRRPRSDRADAVHALLRHFESVGFDGAPRFLGVDQRGREVLSFVEGKPAFKPVPAHDGVVRGRGRLLRRLDRAPAGLGRAPPSSGRAAGPEGRQPHPSSATTTSSGRT